MMVVPPPRAIVPAESLEFRPETPRAESNTTKTEPANISAATIAGLDKFNFPSIPSSLLIS